MSSLCYRAARSLDPAAPKTTPVAPSAAPAGGSNTSAAPPPSRKRAADAATAKAERAKKQKAAADARHERPTTPPPNHDDVFDDIPAAGPLLIDPSGVAHSAMPTADVVDEEQTPPVASPARVTVAVPGLAGRSADPAAAGNQPPSQVTYTVPLVTSPVTPAVSSPPISGALVPQPTSGPLSRVDRFRQAYAGAPDGCSVRSSADPPTAPAGSEDQTPFPLQGRLADLTTHITGFATAAVQQVAASEQSLMVSYSF